MLSTIRLPLSIAFRYITERKQRRFVSFIFWFSMIGMALGTCILILVVSIMNGFSEEIRWRFLTVLPHATLSLPEGTKEWRRLAGQLPAIDGVIAASPSLLTTAILHSPNQLQAIDIQAIEPEWERAVVDLEALIIAGDLSQLDQYGIALGDIAAANLGLYLGDSVQLTVPKMNLSPLGLIPRSRSMRLVAIFRSGSEIDQKVGFIHLDNAQTLLQRPGQATALRLLTRDPNNNQPVLKEALQYLHQNDSRQWQAIPWQRPLQPLLQALLIEKYTTSLLLFIIIVVASFNIFSGLVMLVADKSTDIAILRTLGASTTTIGSIFLSQGLLIGSCGILVGGLIGSILSLYINDILLGLQYLFGFTFYDPEVFYISLLPSSLHWDDLLLIIIGSFAVTILASLYPALKAAQTSPSKILLSHQ